MQEIGRAISLLLSETDNRRNAAIDEIIKQANNSFEIIEAELKEKTEQMEALRIELDELKSTIARLGSALRGGGNNV